MSSARPIILVIEDEPQMRRFLRAALDAEGFAIEEAASAREGLAMAANRRPDAMILDLGLPDLDGVEVIRRVREQSAVPVIVLSARAQEQDKVAALDAGADDYVTKPFGVGELVARLRVALRHAARAARPEDGGAVFEFGDIRVDLAARRVLRSGAEVHLTRTEYRLLAELVRHAGMVLTQRHLLKEVWGPSYIERPHYLRVHMANLRRKLEHDPAQPAHLRTEIGVGYRMVD